MDHILIIAILGVLNIVFLFVNTYQAINQRKLAKKIVQLYVSITDIQKADGNINNQIDEIRSATLSIGNRLAIFENKTKQEIDKVKNSSELNDPQSKLYSRGAKMVELGAEIEEVMRDCDLPRAEAELIINLHRKNT